MSSIYLFFGKCIIKPLLCLWSILWNKEIPLIVYIIGFLLTAWGTYKFTPKINAQFEKQKITTDLLLEQYKDFIKSNKFIIKSCSEFISSQPETMSVSERQKIYTEIQKELATVHYQLGAFKTLLQNKDHYAVNEVANSANDLYKKLSQTNSPYETIVLSKAFTKYGESSQKLINISIKNIQ